MKQLVITGDDAGMCQETNAAMETAFRHGVLTSISVMTNMPAFEGAVAIGERHPALGTGVHLVLTSGRCVSRPERIPLLVRADGTFRRGFLGLWRLLMGPRGRTGVDQVRRELDAQIERALAWGMRIDHIDGHRHVQMVPPVWPIAVALARELGCGFVRVSAERPRTERPWASINAAKAALLRRCASTNARTGTSGAGQPGSAEHFMGALDAGRMTRAALLKALRSLPEGVSEIVTHPSFTSGTQSDHRALSCGRGDVTFLNSPYRRDEAQALIDDQVRRSIDDLGIRLTTFQELAAHRSPGGTVRRAC